MEQISYKGGYKYQLAEDYVTNIDIVASAENIVTHFIDLSTAGELIIKRGYAWDGPSGPTFDTLNFMRGSLVHDALYQLMRNEKLDNEICRDPADRLLKKMCREDGMGWLRASWVYWALHKWGNPAADPSNKKPVILAPHSI